MRKLGYTARKVRTKYITDSSSETLKIATKNHSLRKGIQPSRTRDAVRNLDPNTAREGRLHFLFASKSSPNGERIAQIQLKSKAILRVAPRYAHCYKREKHFLRQRISTRGVGSL